MDQSKKCHLGSGQILFIPYANVSLFTEGIYPQKSYKNAHGRIFEYGKHFKSYTEIIDGNSPTKHIAKGAWELVPFDFENTKFTYGDTCKLTVYSETFCGVLAKQAFCSSNFIGENDHYIVDDGERIYIDIFTPENAGKKWTLPCTDTIYCIVDPCDIKDPSNRVTSFLKFDTKRCKSFEISFVKTAEGGFLQIKRIFN